MKRKLLVTLFASLVLSLLMTACGFNRPGSEAESETQQTPEPTVEFGTPVEVADVETGDITLIYSYNGTLQSKDEVNVLPSLGGKIETLYVDTGDKIEAGETIAVLEKDIYLAQLKQAEAGLKTAELNLAKMKLGSRPEEVAVAQAGVEVARAALDDVATINDDERTRAAAAVARTQAALRQAQSDYDKIAWAGDVGQTREAQALEQATIAYENALANFNLDTNPSDSQLAPLIVQLAQAELLLIRTREPFREVDFAIAETGIEQAQTAVDLANIQLDNTVIEAPFTGIVADRFVTEGSTVGPQAALIQLVTQEVEVAIEVEESRISQFFEGQSVSLQLTAFPDQSFSATVSKIAPVASENTRTFTIEVTPVDESGQLRSGMYADVAVLVDERKNVPLIPRAALTQIGDQQIIYVVEKGVVQQRVVETGLSDGEKVEIVSGLEPGEMVVIAGQPNLIDGAKVEVTNRL